MNAQLTDEELAFIAAAVEAAPALTSEQIADLRGVFAPKAQAANVARLSSRQLTPMRHVLSERAA